MRLRSLSDRTQVEGRLRNQPGSASFSTMALFAPDGKTILTNNNSESRLQLWRTPPALSRAIEVLLAKSPEQRYQTPSEALEALRACLPACPR